MGALTLRRVEWALGVVFRQAFGGPLLFADVSEPELREFLLERAKEGFTFPINPVWPVRDVGWYEVLQALRDNEDPIVPLSLIHI